MRVAPPAVAIAVAVRCAAMLAALALSITALLSRLLSSAFTGPMCVHGMCYTTNSTLLASLVLLVVHSYTLSTHCEYICTCAHTHAAVATSNTHQTSCERASQLDTLQAHSAQLYTTTLKTTQHQKEHSFTAKYDSPVRAACCLGGAFKQFQVLLNTNLMLAHSSGSTNGSASTRVRLLMNLRSS
jgi:hypothetical protein